MNGENEILDRCEETIIHPDIVEKLKIGRAHV